MLRKFCFYDCILDLILIKLMLATFYANLRIFSGVRPTSHTGSIIEYAGSHTTAVSSSSTTQTTTSTSSSSGLSLPTAWSSSWDAPLVMNSINELLNPSRSFGPIGTDYGISTGGSSAQVWLIS